MVSLPLLAQHYRPPLLSVRPQQLPLAPQPVLHPPPLLLRSPLRDTVVNKPVKAKLSGARRVTKLPNSVKAATSPPGAKAPPAVEESDGTPEVNASSAAALASTCLQSNEKRKAGVKWEAGSKRETNGTVPEEITQLTGRCEKPSKEEVKPPGKISSNAAHVKVKKMKHVMIMDEDKNFCTELPLEKDNTLAPKLLQRHFPGVCGLTYRSPHCHHRQWVILDGGKLRAPKGGWQHDVYYCVFSEQSGGKWLHTFCHCSFSKLGKNRRTKSPIKSPSDKKDTAKNRANEVPDKNSQSEEPDVYVVEDGGVSGRQRRWEIAVCSLPQWVTEEQLQDHFARFGRVLTCVVRKDLVGARYGLVEFRDLSSREEALSEVFHRFGDTWCSVHPHS